ncbi:glycosyl hydrolase family 18 protein [Salinarchaeum chitinilyticum]
MNETRRSILRKASALSALAVGASGVASAATCSDAPDWDATTLYETGDQVAHPDGDGVNALWEAAIASRNAEPSRSSAYWDYVGDCGSGGGGGNESPTATFTTDVSTPDPGQDVTFDASGSADPDGSISSYDWAFGDGSTGSGATTSHSYASSGDYTVTLTVTDDAGATATDSTTVSVSSGNAAPDASFTVSPSAPDPGESVTFDAADSSDADGSIASYDWDLGDGSTAAGESVSYSFGSTGDYTVSLTVTDDDGATDTNATTVTVESGSGGGGTTDNRIVGYWMQWAQYDREYVPADIPTDQVTHLQYAFMAPEPDGTISGLGGTSAQKYLFPQSWHDVTTFGDISANTDVTCLISIGGWSDSENFSDVALNESSRQKFADECVRIVREAGVDGVDIDWEYPGGGGHPDNTVREGDQERFTKLIQACRDALDAAGAEDGKDYKLTAAVVADPAKAQGLEHGTLSNLFDFVSVMTFDMRGGFSDYTGHASPLFQNPNDPSSKADTYNVDHAMSWWVDQGWDPGQLNMATPFYGRSFASVQPPSGGLGNGTDDGLFQNFTGTGEGSFPPDTSSSGIYDYWDLSTVGTARATSQVDLSSSAWTTSYDDTANAAWSYNQDDSLMISHPTPDSVATRASWLAGTDYGGTMIWALSHDSVEHHLLGELSNGLL